MIMVQNPAKQTLKLSGTRYDAAFVGNFLAMERWANHSMPVAGETFVII